MRAARHAIAICAALLGLAFAFSPCPPVAQDSWNPFKQNADVPATPARGAQRGGRARAPSRRGRGRAAIPPAQQSRPWAAPRGGTVERSELAPCMAPDASGLPLELWRGLDLKALEDLLAGTRVAAALAGAASAVAAHAALVGDTAGRRPNPEHFVALRLEALYRSGLLRDMEDGAQREPAPRPRSCSALQRAAATSASAARDDGCRTIADAGARPASGLPGRLKGETQLLAGYCAAVANDAQGRRPRGRSCPRGRHRRRAAAGGAGGLRHRHQAEAARCPRASCCSTTASWSCWARSMPPQIFDKAEPALLAVLAGDAQSRTRGCRSPQPRRRCGSTRCRRRPLPEVYRRQSLSAAAPPIRRPTPTIRCCGAPSTSRPPRRRASPAQQAALPARHVRRCAQVRSRICRWRACWPRYWLGLPPSAGRWLVCGDRGSRSRCWQAISTGARRWAEMPGVPHIGWR